MFGLGFAEIMIIAVIAILFLGPDKLPSAMVEVAKFFKNAKNAIGTVKESIENEVNVNEIKEEALAYKRELLDAQESVRKATDVSQIGANLTNLTDDFISDIESEPTPKTAQKAEKVTFEKKPKIKEETTNV